MDAQTLSIQQLVFNATFPIKEEAYALQNRISNLYSSKLHQLLQDFFEVHIPQEVVVKFDQLQFDLGTVDYNDLETVIAERLLAALKEQFPDHKLNNNNTFTAHNDGEYKVQSLKSGLLQLFEVYLTTGSLPWWSVEDNFTILQEKFQQLMADEPIKVRDLILKIAQADNVRKRIAWQLNTLTIHAIVKVLEPAEASFILEYQAGIVQLQKKEQLVKAETDAFEKDIWYFIITFLIKEYGSNFNRKIFVKNTLQTIAAHYNIKFESLLLFLNNATYAEFIILEQADFIKVIKEIFEEEKIVVSEFASPKNNIANTGELTEKLAIITYYFNYGSLPVTVQHLDAASITGLFSELIANNPEAVKNLIVGLQPEILLQRLWVLNNKKLQQEIIELLANEKLNGLPAVLFLTDWNDDKIVKKNLEIIAKLLIDLPAETILERLSILNNIKAKNEIARLIDFKKFDELTANNFLLDWKNSPLQQSISDTVSLELLAFFFKFGAFPKTWPNINAANAIDFIIELAERKPYALKALLNKTKAEKIVKLLQSFNNKNVFEHLFRLLQPSFSNIILKDTQILATILSNHNNKLLKENYLLVQNSALKILLEQKNIDYQFFTNQWIDIIANKLGGDNSAILPELKSFRENTVKDFSIQNKRTNHNIIETEEATTEQFEHKNLINLLRYFILNGTYPWWAEKFIGANPSDLLNELYDTNTLQALQLFKYAGTSQQQMQRFLYQFAVELILKLIQQFPDGQIAAEAYEQILFVYETNIVAEDAAIVSKERLLLQMIWEQYIANNYSGFNVAFFYNNAAKKFFSWHGILPNDIFIHADDIFQHYEKSDIEKLFHAVRLLYVNRQNVISAKPLPDEIFNEFIATLSSLRAGANFSSYINKLIENENSFSLNFDQVFAQDSSIIIPTSPLIKEISVAFISMVATLPHYKNLLLNHSTKIFVENKSTGYMEEVNEPLLMGLIHTLSFGGNLSINKYTNNKTSSDITNWIFSLITEHYLKAGNLPVAFSAINGFSTDSFIKSLLLNFYQTNSESLKNLLENYYFQSGVSQRLYALFNMQDTNDKKILLLLNKINIKGRLAIGTNKSNIVNKDLGLAADSINQNNYPLLQQYYANDADWDQIQNSKKIIDQLDYYLTWGVLPASNTPGNIIIATDDLIKESFLYLFIYNRSELANLLQKETHLFSAKIKLFSLFKTQAGGNDRLINNFLKDFVQEDIVNYFFSEDTENTHTQIQIETGSILHNILPILLKGNFNYNKTELSEIDVVYKAAEVFEYFLLYNKLPDNLNNVVSINTKVFLKNIFEFLFYNNKDRLKSLLGKHTLQQESKMYLYELFTDKQQASDVNIISFINEMAEKDLPTFLQSKIASHFNGDNTEFLQLLKQMYDRPEAEINQILNTVLSYSAGASFLAKNYNGVDIYVLLEKSNKSWANNTLYIIKDLTALFNLNLKETSYLHSIIALLQEFSLLHFAGKITAIDPYQFITRFFVFADERMPILNPGMYQYMKDFRLYIGTNILFSNTAIAMHFQKEIAQRLLHESANNYYPTIEKKITLIEKQTTVNNETLTKIERDENKLAEIKPSTSSDNLPIKENTIIALNEDEILKPKNNISKKIITESDFQKPTEQLKKEPVIEKIGTKIYIQNAGLVLLHPYINTLFEFTGLVKERKFINETALFRAIHLSQYLVDGKAEHEEHLLILNKILCGASLTDPLPKAIELTEKELNISAELFKIVFQRWDKMKNSSIDGFRQSFLQRQGMLIKNEDNWILRVEQRGYDMLLQTIPWAFGTIKLPWMPEFLYVEWI